MAGEDHPTEPQPADAPANPDFAGVAFTGRLLSVSRWQAHRGVQARGGNITNRVDEHTTMLVIGSGGWPNSTTLETSARIERARELNRNGASIRIVSERVFVDLVGLPHRMMPSRKVYDANLACALLDIDPSVLRQWTGLGLVAPEAGRFDFQDLVALQCINDLVERGVAPFTLATALRRLQRAFPDLDRPVSRIRFDSTTGRLFIDTGDEIATFAGRYLSHFDRFCPRPGLRSLREGDFDLPWSAMDWHDHALALEEEGEYGDAIRSYRRALSIRDHFPEVHFNLGYLLRAIDCLEAAEAHFKMAVTQDPAMDAAWYVLAEVQDSMGLKDDATASRCVARAASPSWDHARREMAGIPADFTAS